MRGLGFDHESLNSEGHTRIEVSEKRCQIERGLGKGIRRIVGTPEGAVRNKAVGSVQRDEDAAD